MNTNRLPLFPEPSELEDSSGKPENNTIISRVWQAITEFGMIRRNDSVLVGVSGGPDSVALLYLLMMLAPRLDARIGIAHVNHCLRCMDADEDERFVRELARKFSMPFHSTKTDVRAYQYRHKLSPEDAGRRVRYTFFEKTASRHGYGKLALGHHADDNAELILMNLLRGSGTLGLSGIPPIRQGWIIRPLIRLAGSDIRRFLDINGIPSVTDITNADPAYLRNRVRHEVMPWLEANYNPNLRKTLNRMADIARQEHEWMEQTIAPVFESCVIRESDVMIALDVHALPKVHTAVQRRLFRNAVARVKKDLRRIRLRHIDALAGLLQSRHTAHLDLPDGIRADKTAHELVISLALEPGDSDAGKVKSFEYEVNGPSTLDVNEIQAVMVFEEMEKDLSTDFRSTADTAWFDKEKLEYPLTVRTPVPGDRFRPFGMAGTQKLKKFFNSGKVAPAERRMCPLLISSGRIIWVAGHRTDETTRITAKTRFVLRVRIFESFPAPSGEKS